MESTVQTNHVLSLPAIAVRILPREYRASRLDTSAVLAQLYSLRKRISDAWRPGVTIVEEIRDQRTKPYEVRH